MRVQEMTTLSILAIAFTAFCVWMTVRIVNRREQWAKWTLAIVVASILYVASFGPARAAYVHRIVPEWTYKPMAWFHLPIIWMLPRLPNELVASYESYLWKCCNWLDPSPIR